VSERLLTAREVAERFRCSPDTVLRWTRKGKLHGIKMPDGRLRYRDDDIEAWLAARETKSRAPGEDVRATYPKRPTIDSRVASASDPQKEDDHAT
jgi:excisionase family DNA binding protein